ncbi:MAG: TetR/AcrR family transcriptional regulator [Candidatus Sumerlaeia bacterium]|nr:TetR/AcrR family transcriptional regulator [Candidatus Sumerlaeia bacterium]
MTRREREALQRKTDILQAAEEVFSQKGFHYASMEEVARQAEFSVGTLYNFFKNKDELYAEMLHWKVDLFEPIIKKALQTGDTPLDRIRNFFFTRFDVVWDNPKFFRIYYHESMGTHYDHKAGFTPEVMKRYELFMEHLAGEFRAGVEAGQFADKSVEMMVIIFEGALHQSVLRLQRNPNAKRDKQAEKDLFDLLLSGFAAKPNNN